MFVLKIATILMCDGGPSTNWSVEARNTYGGSSPSMATYYDNSRSVFIDLSTGISHMDVE